MAQKTFNIGQLVDMDWKLGVAVESSNCKKLNYPFISVLLRTLDSNGKLQCHSFEMSIPEFQVPACPTFYLLINYCVVCCCWFVILTTFPPPPHGDDWMCVCNVGTDRTLQNTSKTLTTCWKVCKAKTHTHTKMYFLPHNNLFIHNSMHTNNSKWPSLWEEISLNYDWLTQSS